MEPENDSFQVGSPGFQGAFSGEPCLLNCRGVYKITTL